MPAPIEEIQAAKVVGADTRMALSSTNSNTSNEGAGDYDTLAPRMNRRLPSFYTPAVPRDGNFAATPTSLAADAAPQPPTGPSPSQSGWFDWHERGTSPQEKWLIFKLDWFLLSYSCLCFFIKSLDTNNITNAYASGMQEELGLGRGNELSWMNTYFNVGQLIGAPFANLIITVVQPRYWLPFCLTCWSIFVLFLYKCNTASEFYAMRFCIGLFESAAWPGIEFTLGSWYRKSELARRSALFVISGVLGQMFSGYLQAALYSGMEGHGGMSAWRWLFIFDFILAIPVAVYGIFCHPDTPHYTKAWYFNEWERQRARERIEEEGRKPVGKLDLTVFKRIFTSWQVYVFPLGYALWSLTVGSYVMQYFILYLKSTHRYSIPQINNISTAIGAVNFVTMLTTGVVADKIGRRGPVCLAIGLILTVCYSVLTAWEVPYKLRMFVFIGIGTYGCFTPLLAGWCNECCGGDQQKRAFVLGLMPSVGGAFVIPFQQLQFPSSQAPHFRATHGWGRALAFVIALTLWTGLGIPLVQELHSRKTQTDECQLAAEVGTSLVFHAIHARRDDIDSVHPDTWDWLFDTTEFRDWRDPASFPTHNGVLLIKGKPGAGKSTLMKHAYLRYPHDFFRDRRTVAFFFNARGETLEKKTEQCFLRNS
ncbi:Pantothenate transporter liz1 [Apiospora kogelbergensis]|uniref:Pantothenate transporter liz1 n=1 Tax=Apiospora kogelbergensis TaxID=1337665 RepID=UPI00313095A4